MARWIYIETVLFFFSNIRHKEIIRLGVKTQ